MDMSSQLFTRDTLLNSCSHTTSTGAVASRSSTALPALHSRAASSDLITPEHRATQPGNGANSLPSIPQSPPAQGSRGPSLSFRRTRRERAAESILSSIRRRYATFVDVASYAGLGLVLYAGKVMLLFICTMAGLCSCQAPQVQCPVSTDFATLLCLLLKGSCTQSLPVYVQQVTV